MGQETLYESLLETFREFDPTSTYSLIAYIAGHWGGFVAERDRHNEGRIIPMKVRNLLQERRSGNFSPKPSSAQSGRTLSAADAYELGKKWAERLVKLPEDETLEAFVDAFWEWLLTSDLSGLTFDDGTDYNVVGRVIAFWCQDLGV